MELPDPVRAAFNTGSLLVSITKSRFPANLPWMVRWKTSEFLLPYTHRVGFHSHHHALGVPRTPQERVTHVDMFPHVRRCQVAMAGRVSELLIRACEPEESPDCGSHQYDSRTGQTCQTWAET
ncbi:hypothetical protein GCM10020219_026880 [Nonomuraea dietziae]